MKKTIIAILALAAAVAAYFYLSGDKTDSATNMETPAIETPEVTVVDAVEEEASSLADTLTDVVEGAIDDAQAEVEAVVEDVQAQAEDAVESLVDDAQNAVENLVEGATDSASAATENLTETTQSIADAATDAVADTTETAVDAATDATEATDVNVESENSILTADSLKEMVEGSELGPVQKAALLQAIEAASENPEVLAQILERAKTAMGL